MSNYTHDIDEMEDEFIESHLEKNKRAASRLKKSQVKRKHRGDVREIVKLHKRKHDKETDHDGVKRRKKNPKNIGYDDFQIITDGTCSECGVLVPLGDILIDLDAGTALCTRCVD